MPKGISAGVCKGEGKTREEVDKRKTPGAMPFSFSARTRLERKRLPSPSVSDGKHLPIPK